LEDPRGSNLEHDFRPVETGQLVGSRFPEHSVYISSVEWPSNTCAH